MLEVYLFASSQVSIVVPVLGLNNTNYIYLGFYKVNPQKGTDMETVGRMESF